MVAATSSTRPARRKMTKEKRREQLMKATIRSVAKRGFAETTMADVTREAGLSQGIVNLHFRSKDRLFEETLRYLSDEYETACYKAMANAGSSAADKLRALVNLDFSAKVCDRKKLAVWFAFWGAVKSRPTYLQICAKNDRRYEKMVSDLCQEIIDEGHYDVTARAIANGMSAIVNGLWLDLLLTPEDMDRDAARDICLSYLGQAFPHHMPVQPATPE